MTEEAPIEVGIDIDKDGIDDATVSYEDGKLKAEFDVKGFIGRHPKLSGILVTVGTIIAVVEALTRPIRDMLGI